MLTRQNVAAATPVWVRDKLSGFNDSTYQVIHSGPDAIYIDIGSDVIAVVSRNAIAVPCALQTTLPTMADLSEGVPPPGTCVRIGNDGVDVAGARVRVARIVSFQAPPFSASDAAAMQSALAPSAREVIPRIRHELPDDALSALLHACPSAAADLIGLGSGLTPLGDDVLCGCAAALTAAQHPCAEPVSTAINAHATHQTTPLSATLLRRAVAGDAVGHFTRLLQALRLSADKPREASAAVTDLARIGHTSGAGLVLGLSIALDHLASRSYCP